MIRNIKTVQLNAFDNGENFETNYLKHYIYGILDNSQSWLEQSDRGVSSSASDINSSCSKEIPSWV